MMMMIMIMMMMMMVVVVVMMMMISPGVDGDSRNAYSMMPCYIHARTASMRMLRCDASRYTAFTMCVTLCCVRLCYDTL